MFFPNIETHLEEFEKDIKQLLKKEVIRFMQSTPTINFDSFIKMLNVSLEKQ
jgi:hypothetical protein